MYSEFDKKECTEVHYNYVQACMESNGDRIDCYSDYWQTAKVGENGVVKIHEHSAAGEGDKWYYDIVKDDKTVERIFNPHRAFYRLLS